jgi:hypothetical protein
MARAAISKEPTTPETLDWLLAPLVLLATIWLLKSLFTS